MTNKEAWETYQKYTLGVTVHSRKLAFGGAALCWILKTSAGFSGWTLAALVFLVLFFITDLLQYCVGALQTYRWISREEKKRHKNRKSLSGDYPKPESVDKPAFYLFWFKLLPLFIGFLCIGIAILKLYYAPQLHIN